MSRRNYHYRNTSSRQGAKGKGNGKILLRFWRESRSTIAVVLSVVVVGYFVAAQPIWMAESQAQTIANQRVAQERAEVVTSTMERIGEVVPWLIALVVVAGVLFALVKVYEIYSRSQLQWAMPDANTGMFPLQRVNAAGGGVGGFIGQLLGNSFETIIDVNKSISPTIAPMQIETQIDSGQQLAYSTTVAKGAVAKQLASKGTRATVVRATMTSMDRHNLPKPTAPAALPTLAAPEPALAPVELIDAKQAFAMSNADEWIVGQSVETGEYCKLYAKKLTSFAVAGATGTGKTARVGSLIMANALRSGWHVIALDGKAGPDWRRYEKYVEFSDLDYENIATVVDTLNNEMIRRQQIINQYEENSIWGLPSGTMRPILTIIDEFGAVMDSLKAFNKNQYNKVDTMLGNLFRKSRSTGIIVVACDQNPTRWSATMRANFTENVFLKVGGGAAGAYPNAYEIAKLPKDGSFFYSDDEARYKAFDTWNDIDGLLPKNYRKPAPLIDFGATADDPDDDSTGTSTFDARTYAAEAVARIEAKAEAPSKKASKPELPEKPLLTGPVSSRREQIVFQQALERYKTQNKVCMACWGVLSPKTRNWYKEALAKVEGN